MPLGVRAVDTLPAMTALPQPIGASEAAGGYATPTGVRLHTLADVFAAAEGLAVRLDGTEIQSA
jgi:hypothetical protein